MTNNKLIALRITEEIFSILEKSRKVKKLSRTEFIIQSILKNAGYDYIPAKIIKSKLSK